MYFAFSYTVAITHYPSDCPFPSLYICFSCSSPLFPFLLRDRSPSCYSNGCLSSPVLIRSYVAVGISLTARCCALRRARWRHHSGTARPWSLLFLLLGPCLPVLPVCVAPTDAYASRRATSLPPPIGISLRRRRWLFKPLPGVLSSVLFHHQGFPCSSCPCTIFVSNK